MGDGVLYTANQGTYYINGFMVNNETETIIVEKYDKSPTCLVGFLVKESFITSNEDPSLLDNSQGSSNFAAPGADRLQITLKLARVDVDMPTPNFIRLATILEGNVEGNQAHLIKWDWLYDIMAKRTFDESGNYIIKDFIVKQAEELTALRLRVLNLEDKLNAKD